jgi:prepilin peptidase CpaA
MHTIAWWPTLLAVAVATVTDIRSRRIPNWLVVPFLLAGIAVSGWQNGWQGVGQSFLGIGLGAVLFGFLSFLGGMGMGDVKLMAAIGAWIGPLTPDRGWIGPLEHMGVALILIALAGGIMAICWAVSAGFLGSMLRGTGLLIFGFARRGLRPNPEFVLSNPLSRKMPYAPAIAIGTLLSFLAG